MADHDSKLQSDPAPPDPAAIARGHEGTAVSMRGIVYTMATLIVVAAITHVVVWYMMIGYEKASARQDPRPSPLAREVEAAPPQPWLQPSPPQGAEVRQPWQDMEAYRKREDARLNSYRVLDAKSGLVQIPVERAMQILAAPTTGPTSRPSDKQPNREPTGGQP